MPHCQLLIAVKDEGKNSNLDKPHCKTVLLLVIQEKSKKVLSEKSFCTNLGYETTLDL